MRASSRRCGTRPVWLAEPKDITRSALRGASPEHSQNARKPSERARATGRVRWRARRAKRCAACSGYGHGSPRAAGGRLRARNKKRTLQGPGRRNLVLGVCMRASAALVVEISGSRRARSSTRRVEGGRHHLFERDTMNRVGSRRADGGALQRRKEHRGACEAPGVGATCAHPREEREALIRTGGMRTQTLGRCAPARQVSGNSNRAEGLRHKKSPDDAGLKRQSDCRNVHCIVRGSELFYMSWSARHESAVAKVARAPLI